jgi:hypothetical protein
MVRAHCNSSCERSFVKRELAVIQASRQKQAGCSVTPPPPHTHIETRTFQQRGTIVRLMLRLRVIELRLKKLECHRCYCESMFTTAQPGYRKWVPAG